MKQYDFDVKLNTKHFMILIDTNACYGYFEHDHYGDGVAGGLWFDPDKVLLDYDGVFELPKEVEEALIKEGYDTSI